MGIEPEAPELRKARLEREHVQRGKQIEAATAQLAESNRKLRVRQENDSGRWRCKVIGCCVAGTR